MPATYVIVDGNKRLQFEDGSQCDVVAPLSLDAGANVVLIASQAAILEAIRDGLQELNNTAASTWERIQSASDRTQAITYLDAGTADERINDIVYASASLGLTITETFSYAGSAGNYRLTGTARA
ncbi:MAG: hypothetical protein F6K42_15470 [Leptolyngbya sp. SIO1D8]|nr:hypothetical protein [Leptolyngbya sp. SIO1D8]